MTNGHEHDHEQGETPADRYQRLHGITIAQDRALAVLLGGGSHAEAATAAGVHRVTVTRWMNYDVAFQAALNRRRADANEACVSRYRAMLPKALAVIEESLNHGCLNPVTSRVALRLLELSGIAERLCDVGPVDPTDVVSARAAEHERHRDQRHAVREVEWLDHADEQLAEVEHLEPKGDDALTATSATAAPDSDALGCPTIDDRRPTHT